MQARRRSKIFSYLPRCRRYKKKEKKTLSFWKALRKRVSNKIFFEFSLFECVFIF